MSNISAIIVIVMTTIHMSRSEAYVSFHYNYTGQPAMGALLSKRNSISYTTETTILQLIKRDMNSFCVKETNMT